MVGNDAEEKGEGFVVKEGNSLTGEARRAPVDIEENRKIIIKKYSFTCQGSEEEGEGGNHITRKCSECRASFYRTYSGGSL